MSLGHLVARWVVVGGIVAAAASAVAAANWHNTWNSFATTSGGPATAAAVHAESTFQFWLLVCAFCLVAALAALAWIVTTVSRRFGVPDSRSVASDSVS